MGQDSGDFAIWGTHRHCFLIVFTHKGCGFLRCVSGGEEDGGEREEIEGEEVRGSVAEGERGGQMM